MSNSDTTGLGRFVGFWTLVDDVPAYLANGWKLLDDGAHGGPRGYMLLEPPAGWNEEQAA